MATFLSAMDEAERGRVERYEEALKCLDLSGLADLPEDARAPQARKLASLLNDFVVQHGIELEIIPDDAQGPPHTYFRDATGQSAIQLRRHQSGAWLFTWSSLAFVAERSSQTDRGPQDLPLATGERGGTAGSEAREQSGAQRTQPEPARIAPISQVPADYASARATMRSFLDAMRADRLGEAAKCLDLSDVPLVVQSEKGIEFASYLHRAIKWTKDVILPTIPDDPGGRPFIFRQDELGIIVVARQRAGSGRAGHWLFTKETVAGLDDLYDVLQTRATAALEARRQAGGTGEEERVTEQIPFTPSLWLRAQVPESLKGTWILLKHWQWLGLIVLFFVGRIAQRLTTALLRLVARLWLRRKGVAVGEAVQLGTFRPVGILAAAALWWVGLTWLALRADVLAPLLIAVKFVACWAMVWTVYRAVDLLGDYFSVLAEKTETKVDDLLVPFARKIAKVVVTVFGIVFIIHQFTEETPFKLLAGLGLGGLALALAAQDTLKNLFGSLTVIADRPFKVGDWVLIGDIEGMIESVGFRSTRVRTFYNSQVVVPNASLMSATIDNYGARRYRRIKIMLSLTYATSPEKINAFCEGIRELIRLHPYTRKDYYHVYFNKFAASSLDVLLYCFLETPDWGTELRERHRLFIDVLRLADKLEVEFAFPTQTVWLARSRGGAEKEGVPMAPGRDDPDSIGVQKAAQVFEEAYDATSADARPTPRPAPVIIVETPRSKPGV